MRPAGVLNAEVAGRRLANLREVDLELVTDEKHEDRSQGGEDDAGWMKTRITRTRKHMRNCSADDRADNPEHDGPKDRHVRMHDGFRDEAGDQADKDVPD